MKGFQFRNPGGDSLGVLAIGSPKGARHGAMVAKFGCEVFGRTRDMNLGALDELGPAWKANEDMINAIEMIFGGIKMRKSVVFYAGEGT